jgi:hypothetical protein
MDIRVTWVSEPGGGKRCPVCTYVLVHGIACGYT